jgi:hypothetical protein
MRVAGPVSGVRYKIAWLQKCLILFSKSVIVPHR